MGGRILSRTGEYWLRMVCLDRVMLAGVEHRMRYAAGNILSPSVCCAFKLALPQECSTVLPVGKPE